MRSKLFNTVLVLAIVGPFAYFVATEAVQIKQHLEEQHSQIKTLSIESVKLDKNLLEISIDKAHSSQEVQLLEQQVNDTLSDRKKLEAELEVN